MNKFSKFQAEVICELHPLFKGLVWVSSARSTDETRYVITTINVERSGMEWKMIATDGRRMHVSTFDAGLFADDLEMIEPGLWEVIAKTNRLIVIAPSEIGGNYPNWKALIPESRPYFKDTVFSNTISKLGIRTGVLLNSDFVTDAIGFGTVVKKADSVDIEFSADPEGGAFLIRHEVGAAIVMPMKITEAEEHAPEAASSADNTPDMPGFEDAFSPLTDAMEEGDVMTISVGGKDVAKFEGKKGGKRK